MAGIAMELTSYEIGNSNIEKQVDLLKECGWEVGQRYVRFETVLKQDQQVIILYKKIPRE